MESLTSKNEIMANQANQVNQGPNCKQSSQVVTPS